MAVFLSPGVFTREIDLSILPSAVGAMQPAFIGTAKKGPINEPTLITTASQFVETFGEPFPESYLGYAVLAYLEEGNSCYVLRTGIEYRDGMKQSLADIAIDTSGAKVQGWGRIPVFRGIDNGVIKFRPIGDGVDDNPSPVIIHEAGVEGVSNGTLSGAYNDAEADDTDVTEADVEFTNQNFTGCDTEVFTISITGDPTATGPIEGATYNITDSSGDQVASGTFSVATDDSETEEITLTGLGLSFYIKVTSGTVSAGDSIVFSAKPDNTELKVKVNGGSEQTFTIDEGTYSSSSDFLDAVSDAIGSTDFSALLMENEDGVEVVSLRTNSSGEWIQLTGSCALATEVGVPQYIYDVPRSFLISTETGPYILSSTNNRVVMDVIGRKDTLQFDFTLPTGSNISASAVASAITSNGTFGGVQYFEGHAITTPGGDTHVLIVTTDQRKFDQLKLQANFSHLSTLRLAEELGIQFPYTRNFRAFSDNRVELPEESPITPGQPKSCDDDPQSDQCSLDSDYYNNIVGWIISKYPGTWVDDYRINIELFTDGVGDVAGRYKLSVIDKNGIVVDVVEDVSFDPDAERYIGNVVNEGSPIGGARGNEFYRWESRPDSLMNGVRNPSSFTSRSFLGAANGIPEDAEDSAALDKAIIGNPATSTGIHAFQNPESFDFNLLVTPGFSSGPVIAQAIQFCENRGDVLYLVDPPFGLRPQQVIDWHNGMLTSDLTSTINTSYGALYWSWLRISDQFNGGTIWIPPSGHISAIFARTDRRAEQWFAPAGLNRGRILSALDIEYNPTQGERDALYGSGNAVNAIVNFTQQGITVWGQRTLQRRSTALDRVNVRMLLIFLKKNLSILLRNFVFEQNDSATRSQILNVINPFLADIAARRGLNAYHVVSDETNNTPERIDRNELWVSVFIQPTRVAEFIVLNLVVLRTGAGFGAQEVLAAGGIVTGQ